MNTEQVAWAQMHDWYLSCFMNSDGLYIVRTTEEMKFTNFEELTIWAGY